MSTPAMTPDEQVIPAAVPRGDLDARVEAMRAADAARDVQVPGRTDRTVLRSFESDPRFRRGLALAEADPERVQRQLEELDREPLIQIDKQRRGERWGAYVDGRPSDYVDSGYMRLYPQQNPDGRVTGWWASKHLTLLLTGPSSHGKTDSAYAITNEVALADREAPLGTPQVRVRAWSMVRLLEELQTPDVHERNDDKASRRRARILADCRSVDLLLLDDVCAERPEGYWAQRWRDRVFSIVDARSSNGLRTIFTLNVTEKKDLKPKLEETYGTAVTLRIAKDAVAAWVEGEPLRRFATWDPFA